MSKLTSVEKSTLLLSSISIIVAFGSLLLNYHTWHKTVTPSVEFSCESKILPNSFKTIRNGTNVYSSYTLEICVDIANTSSQGCVIHCDPFIRRTLSNLETLDLHLSKKAVLPMDSDNPIDSIVIDGQNSYSSTIQMDVFFDVPTTALILQEFSDYNLDYGSFFYEGLKDFDPYKAINYLKTIDASPTLMSLYTENDPGWGVYYNGKPDIANPDQLIFCFSSNLSIFDGYNSKEFEIDYLKQ